MGRTIQVIVGERYFLTVSRYIELNPVRAKMVDHPSDYPWSSYQKNALGKAIKLITPHPCYQALGTSDKCRRAAYRALFEQHLPDDTLAEIREATNKAWVLGEERFKKQIESQTGRAVQHPSPVAGIESQRNIGQVCKINYSDPFDLHDLVI